MTEQVEKGNAMGCLVTGVITGVCGLATAICGFVWVSLGGGGGFGLWSGFGMIVIAILGILVYVKRSKGIAIGYMVLNIFWIILASIQAALAGIAALLFAIWIAALETAGCKNIGDRCVCSGNDALTYELKDCDELYMMRNSLTAMMAFCAIGAISCFAGSIIACCIACCGKQTNVQPVVVVNQPPQQVVVTQTGYPAQAYPPAQPYPPPQQPDNESKVEPPPAY